MIKDFLLKLRSLKYFFELVWYFPRTRSESIFESILIRNWEIMRNRKMKNRKYDATNYDMSWNPGSVFTELPFWNSGYYRGGLFWNFRNRKEYKIGQIIEKRLICEMQKTEGRFFFRLFLCWDDLRVFFTTKKIFEKKNFFFEIFYQIGFQFSALHWSAFNSTLYLQVLN